MTDQDADTSFESPVENEILLDNTAYAQNPEPNDSKIVGFTQQENIELELKRIEQQLETKQKLLAFEKEKFEFEYEKEMRNIALRRERTKAEREDMELKTLQDSRENSLRDRAESRRCQRQQSNASHWFKMLASTILISSGIWLVYRGDNLGPFLMGTGAAGAGIQSVSELGEKRRREELGDSVSDSKDAETKSGD